MNRLGDRTAVYYGAPLAVSIFHCSWRQLLSVGFFGPSMIWIWRWVYLGYKKKLFIILTVVARLMLSDDINPRRIKIPNILILFFSSSFKYFAKLVRTFPEPEL